MAKSKKQSVLPLDNDVASPAVRGATDDEPQTSEPKDDASFEDAVTRLGQIVERLESDGLPLDESLKLFEEGVRLARKSQLRLENAERRVQELLSFDENGNPIVEELDQE